MQGNHVGNWKSAGNSVKCQDVTNAQGKNQSRCYSAPLLQEVMGQLWSLQLAGVLFQTLTQSKRGFWKAALTRRKKHSPFSYLNFFSFSTSLGCFWITAHLDFSWELRGVFPWTDEQKYMEWLELSLQKQQTQGSPAAWAVRVMGSTVCGCYSVLRLNMKRLRYALGRLLGEWQHHLIFCPLFWGDASWNCHLTQDQFISWDVSSRQVLICPKLGS